MIPRAQKNQSSWLDRVGAVKFTQLFHGKITSGLQDLQNNQISIKDQFKTILKLLND